MQSSIETQSPISLGGYQYLQVKPQKKDDLLINLSYDYQISPWNSQRYSRILKPTAAYQTIDKYNSYGRKRMKSRKKIDSSSLTISKDFFNLLKKQKKQSSLSPQRQTLHRINFINVNLDQQILSNPSKKCAKTIQRENKKSPSPQKSVFKEQPVRMKILKRILHKDIKQYDPYYIQKQQEFNSSYTVLRGKSGNQKQSSVLPSLVQNILKDYGQNSKICNLYKYGYENLPKKQQAKPQSKQISTFICQGQIIAKQYLYSKKRIQPKHTSVKDKSRSQRQQKLVFLQQFSAQL